MGLLSYLSQLSRRFGTLRWRLTFSYFMTAFVALFFLVVTFVGVPSIFALTLPPPQHPVAFVEGLKKLAPQAAPYMSQTPPNRVGLTNWLHVPKDAIASFSSGVPVDQESTFTVIPGQNAVLWVVNTDSQVIATLAPAASNIGNLSGLQGLPETHTAIAAALANRTDTALLLQSLPDGRAVAAMPIIDTAGVVRGALVLGVDLHALQRSKAVSGLFAVGGSLILFTLIASVLGALIGQVMARGLTRRLRRLTVAADAWSHGDFTASISDPSVDELGQLASDLNRMALQLQNLLRDEQQLAVMEERNRLARDLHDSVKQQIFAVTMLVGSAQLEVSTNFEAQRILAEAERISSSAQQELTALIHALRPVALADKGLSEALREACHDWAERTHITSDVIIEDGLVLPPLAEPEVFRVMQEILSNVARHSGATQVEVRAQRCQDILALRIQDNGHGFDTTQAEGEGLGLRSMRERIAGVNGTVRIYSAARARR